MVWWLSRICSWRSLISSWSFSPLSSLSDIACIRGNQSRFRSYNFAIIQRNFAFENVKPWRIWPHNFPGPWILFHLLFVTTRWSTDSAINCAHSRCVPQMWWLCCQTWKLEYIWWNYFIKILLSPLQTANETRVSECVLFFVLLSTQVTESVDDHTKDQIQYYNDEHDEERKVVHYAPEKVGFLQRIK